MATAEAQSSWAELPLNNGGGRVQWEPRTFANERGTYIHYEPERYEALLAKKVGVPGPLHCQSLGSSRVTTN